MRQREENEDPAVAVPSVYGDGDVTRKLVCHKCDKEAGFTQNETREV